MEFGHPCPRNHGIHFWHSRLCIAALSSVDPFRIKYQKYSANIFDAQTVCEAFVGRCWAHLPWSTDGMTSRRLMYFKMFSVFSMFHVCISWWRHFMDTLSALLVLYEWKPPVIGGPPSQKVRDSGFDVFFDVCYSKRLNKQSSWPWLWLSIAVRCCSWIRYV